MGNDFSAQSLPYDGPLGYAGYADHAEHVDGYAYGYPDRRPSHSAPALSSARSVISDS